MYKNSFILYVDYYEYIKDLPYEEIGRLSAALFELMLGNEDVKLSGETRMAFKFIKAQIMRDNEKYEKKVERMSQATKEVWKKRKEKEASENAIACNCMQMKGDTVTVNDTVNDNDNVTVTVNDNDASDARKPYGKKANNKKYKKYDSKKPKPSYDLEEFMKRNDAKELVYRPKKE